MATSTLGSKYECFMCQCKFYDMGRPEPICPRCGANQREAAPTKPSRPSSRAAAKAAPVERVREPEESYEGDGEPSLDGDDLDESLGGSDADEGDDDD